MNTQKLFLSVVLCLFIVVSTVSALEIQQVYSVDRTSADILQRILTNKASYNKGDTIKIENFQDINAYCSQLSVVLYLKKGNSIIDTYDRSFGAGGYYTTYYIITHDSSAMSAGTYTIEARWSCDGQELGIDGYVDSNRQPDIKTFSIVSENNPPTPEQCDLTCAPGEKLVNPSSEDCYCIPEYTLNNGVCELGEPVASADCEEKLVCHGNQIKIEGLCIDPNRICIADGGTLDCNGDESIALLAMFGYGLGVFLFMLGLYITFGVKD